MIFGLRNSITSYESEKRLMYYVIQNTTERLRYKNV